MGGMNAEPHRLVPPATRPSSNAEQRLLVCGGTPLPFARRNMFYVEDHTRELMVQRGLLVVGPQLASRTKVPIGQQISTACNSPEHHSLN